MNKRHTKSHKWTTKNLHTPTFSYCCLHSIYTTFIQIPPHLSGHPFSKLTLPLPLHCLLKTLTLPTFTTALHIFYNIHYTSLPSSFAPPKFITNLNSITSTTPELATLIQVQPSTFHKLQYYQRLPTPALTHTPPFQTTIFNQNTYRLLTYPLPSLPHNIINKHSHTHLNSFILQHFITKLSPYILCLI